MRTNAVGVVALATVGLGVFAVGSNGSIRIRVDLGKPFVDVPRVTEVTTIYQPTAAEITQAAKT